MPNYRISDPTDVRDLGDQIAAWQAAGNPKANEWAEQPAQPTPAHQWIGGAWVAPELPDPIAAGESWVAAQGYGASRMVTLLDELLTADRNGTTAQRPKLVAVYQWSQTVKGMALAGAVEFPSAPWSFEEVLSEGAAK